jgi:hypothetical protein
MRSLFAGLALLGTLGSATESLAQAVAIGDEFQVNVYTTGGQVRPAVAIDAGGGFVVVWESGHDGGFYTPSIFGRRFNSAGVGLGQEFQVNDYTTQTQDRPTIAAADDGRFVVVWESDFRDGSVDGVFGRLFDSTGTAIGTDFQVSTYTFNSQRSPRAAMRPDGQFVVVWNSYGDQDGSLAGVFGRRFDSAGTPLAGEFQLNTFTSLSQYQARIAMRAEGDFVVAWESFGQDGQQRGVFGQRFDSVGAKVGGEFHANTYTPAFQDDIALAVAPSGAFLVIFSNGTSMPGAFARYFDSNGTAVGAQFQVAATAFPEAATDRDGFLALWSVNSGVMARRYDSSGVAQGADFAINTYTFRGVSDTAVAANADGDFVVAWTSGRFDGPSSSTGIFARRHLVLSLAPLDVDGSTSVGALTDGLLALRFLFGFTGSSLVTGATDGTCTRCSAADILAYLNGLGLALDIDGDGALGALTDGLLILRFLFGFTGASLTQGAVAMPGCTRCDAAAIVPYLETLTLAP